MMNTPPYTAPDTPAETPTPIPDGTRRIAFPQTRPILTYALLAINIGLFLLTYAVDQTIALNQLNPIIAFGALDYDSILQNGEVYRLFTCMFLHLSWAHILFNGYALWSLGRGLESVMGHARFLSIYLLGGLVGSLLSFIIGRGASAGASGAIFALFAAELVFVYRHRVLIGPAAGSAIRELILLAGLNLGLGLLTAVTPTGVKIDNWGHIGGFIGGLIVASALAPQYSVSHLPSGMPTITDERPYQKRWPFTVGILITELIVIGVAYQTLPR